MNLYVPLGYTNKVNNKVMASNWYHGRGGSRFLEGQFKNGKPISSMTSKFGIHTRMVVYSNVKRGVTKAMMKIYGRTREGLEAAVDYLEWSMNNKKPMTPEKTTRLRKAFYKEVIDTPDGPAIEFGYKTDKGDPNSAPYFPYVHEMTEPPYDHVQWTLPGSGPEWFRIHLQNDKEAMLYLIKIYAKSAIV